MVGDNDGNQTETYGAAAGHERTPRNNQETSAPEPPELIYMREIKALELQIKRLKKEQKTMSTPFQTSAQSEVHASDFNSGAYVSKEIELGAKIKNSEQKLEIAIKRYHFLFDSD